MPKDTIRIGTLEIEPEAAHLNATFILIQKISVGIMTLILFAGLIGLFGAGFLGQTSAVSPSLQVNYDRFARTQAVNVFHINIIPDAHNHPSTNLQFWISQAFFRKISVKSFNPAPVNQEIRNDKIIYTFHTSQNSDIVHITLSIEPEEFGNLQAEMGLINANMDNVKINQFIYP